MKPFLTFVCLAASAANAAIITYTDRNAFLAALSGASYEESFSGLVSGGLGGTSMNFSGSGLGYTISANGVGLFGTTISGDRSMSVGNGSAPLNIDSFTGGVVAVGGYFYFDNGDSALETTAAGNVTASNGIDGNAIVQVGPNTSLTTFVGFISSTPMDSVSFMRTSNTSGFVNVDDLIVASAGTQGVPEPGSIALTVAGLATLLTLRKRR